MIFIKLSVQLFCQAILSSYSVKLFRYSYAVKPQELERSETDLRRF